MVNTFLPEESFTLSLMSLDYKRLGKQRVETKQILRALRCETEGWRMHPAARMWQGHEGALAQYGSISCRLWKQLGYTDTLLPYFEEMEEVYPSREKPWWISMDAFRRSHQSNLIRKDPAFYSHKWPGVPNDLPYLWPVPKEGYDARCSVA